MKHTSMNITESLWGVVGLDTKAYSMKFQPTWEKGAGGFGSAPVHGQIMHACYLKNCLEPGQFYVSVIPFSCRLASQSSADTLPLHHA
jgi:hypothetical protein